MPLHGPLQICADHHHQCASFSSSLCAQILLFQPSRCQLLCLTAAVSSATSHEATLIGSGCPRQMCPHSSLPGVPAGHALNAPAALTAVARDVGSKLVVPACRARP